MLRALDHWVLTVRDLEATCAFYQHLGCEVRRFGAGRLALHFGLHKINLHLAGREFEPKAQRPTPGSADLCFLVSEDLTTVQQRLADAGIPILEGPVQRTGANGPIRSVYIRDPDGNLLELSTPLESE